MSLISGLLVIQKKAYSFRNKENISFISGYVMIVEKICRVYPCLKTIFLISLMHYSLISEVVLISLRFDVLSHAIKARVRFLTIFLVSYFSFFVFLYIILKGNFLSIIPTFFSFGSWINTSYSCILKLSKISGNSCLCSCASSSSRNIEVVLDESCKKEFKT